MSQPEIITVNSEALEAQIREQLPSQSGFGSELQASNVIMPIIDLTSAAEGSSLGANLQTALSHGSAIPFAVVNGNSTITSTAGFYRVFGTCVYEPTTAVAGGHFQINNGVSSVKIYELRSPNGTANATTGVASYDFVVFLAAGDSLICTSFTANSEFAGSIRQIATVTGNLVHPVGFVAE